MAKIFLSYLFLALLGFLATRNGVKGKSYRGPWKSCAIFLWGGLLLLAMGINYITIDQDGRVHDSTFLLLGAVLSLIGLSGAVVLSGLQLYRRIQRHS